MSISAWPWKAIFIVSAWFLVNIIFTLYNKWLFNEMHFTFPIFMTVTHMVATSIASGSLIFFVRDFGFDLIYAKFKRSFGWLMLLMFCYAGNIVLNNTSLVFISIVLNQIIRTLLPLATIVLSRLIEKKRYSGRIYVVISSIVLGVGMTVYRNLEFQWIGATCVAVSTAVAALWTVISAKLMNNPATMSSSVIVINTSHKDDDNDDDDDDDDDNDNDMAWMPIELLFAVSLPSACLLAVGFFALEFEQFKQYDYEDRLHVAIMVAMGCMFAFIYNLLHYAMIHVTSSVHSTILGNAKIIILILLSIPLFGIIVQWWNVVGICWTLLSMLLYSALSYQDHQRKEQAYARMLVEMETEDSNDH